MSSTEASTLVSTAQILGIAGSTFLSGYIFSASALAIPTLNLAENKIRTQQWEFLFIRGRNTSPPQTIIYATCFAYLARHFSKLGDSKAARLYTLAACTVPMIVPWTLIVMRHNYTALQAIAKRYREEGKGDDRMEGLMTGWMVLNGVRACIPLAAGIIGLCAVVGV